MRLVGIFYSLGIMLCVLKRTYRLQLRLTLSVRSVAILVSLDLQMKFEAYVQAPTDLNTERTYASYFSQFRFANEV